MILNKEQLSVEAHKSALSHDPFIKRKPFRRFWNGHVSDMEKIRAFVNQLRRNHSTCSQPAEEWLLDNAEFLEEQALTIKHELSKQLIDSLPHLSKKGEPRILSICKDYINYTDGHIDIDTFLSYIHAYQEVSILKIAEVWSIPVIMRIALIHRLAEMTDELKARLDICTKVNELLSGINSSELNPENLNKALDDAGLEMPLAGSMIVHLVRHLQERADYTAMVSEWLSCKLENGTDSLEQILSYEYQLQASYQMSTGNIIGSMRKLLRFDWHELFEQMSLVEQTLRTDSTGVYPLLDVSSRSTLRKRIERLSLRLNLPENLIASQAVQLADEYVQQAPHESTENPGRRASVAFYLLEPAGLKYLRLGLKKCGEGKPRMVPENGFLRRSTETYFNMLVLMFAAALFSFSVWIGWNWSFTALQWLAIVLVLAMPAMEWAVTAVHWLIEQVKHPIPLLRYDFSKGIPKEAATMVVIPVIWSTKEEIAEITERLELHYLANRDSNLHFAILSDFKDAKTEQLDEDKVIIEAAIKEIKRLNRAYPDSSFYLFQRRRLWNPSENAWMGWERKRGKLVEFIELLKGKKDSSFTVIEGEVSLLKEIRYIITLDADTKLPLESAQRMVGTMHLPFNRPRLNKTETRVIEGYGVLQPRIGMSHEAASKSRFAALWSGDPGVDPYAFAVSDTYQDGLGQGIFTGKGIFDIDVFYQVLCERIPENRVLSHDLLEGGFLRTGVLSDIELIDDHPAHFHSFQKRLHRWVRGDWQLVSWLLPRMINRSGKLLPVDLSILTRWQIIDNLRRSLLSPVLLLTLLLALTILPGSPIRWFAIVMITWLLPLFRQLAVIQANLKHSKGLLFTAGQVVVNIITLPFQTILLLDAIGRSLYRLLISKRKLLEWTTSAEAERNSQRGKAPALLGMAGGYILTLLFFVAAVFSGYLPVQITGTVLAVLWACAPFVIGWLNQPVPQESLSFSSSEKEELYTLSRQIWSFYEDYVTEEDYWLPPDNVQMEPSKGAAHRTSPTNIGLYMSCALAARDFEFIDTPGLIQRLERTISTMEKMEKWEGHLYNWYDTMTLAPLKPIYVSTVDSGNLVCCLITVKEGLLEWMQHDLGMDSNEILAGRDQSLQIAFSEELTPVIPGDFAKQSNTHWRDRGRGLLERIEKFIDNTNFRPLYDHKARLFSLGWHIERHERDEVLYDLMASEARSASFASIALGQVSVAHWNALGRTMTKTANRPLLLSWSGTMFEYLMPWLFMKTYRNTLWDSTYKAVVQRQIEYAKQRNVPFGISESGYFAFDYQMNYQYRAFGVPGLGFKRGLDQDLVTAPYAAILALPFAKSAALETLKKFEQLKARGKYGFYEAVDFTKRRLPKQKEYMVIRSFMAHHQGMSLLTLANVLLPKKMYERFHQNKAIRAAELLLQERIPKRPKLINHPAMNRVHKPFEKITHNITPIREFDSPQTRTPAVNILSNGTFTTMVTNSGSGYSQYRDMLISRWREDPVMDSWGSFIYIRDISENTVWSPSYQPCRVDTPEARVQFGLDRAVFMRSDGDIRTTMEITVSPEWNAEVRRITLLNKSLEAKVLEVTTFVELSLSNPIADAAHTAFSKLFIRTDFDPESECLIASRRPREVNGNTLWSAHSLMIKGDTLGSIEFETDRSSFIGRGYSLSEPQGIRGRLRGQTGSVADPAFVMRRRVSVGPGEQVQLMAVTSAADTCEEAIQIVRNFTAEQSVERTYQMAWNRVQIELRHLQLSNKEAVEFQELAGHILYRAPLRKEQASSILTNQKGQSGLWSFGVSGDRPICLVRIGDSSHMPFIQKILTGHEYLRRLGLLFDLVILNESIEGYQQNLQEAVQSAAEHGVDRFGAASSGVYTIAANQLSEEDTVLLMAAARVILQAGRSSLTAQLRLPKTEELLPEALVPNPSFKKENAPSMTLSPLIDTKNWQFFNGWGGFSPDGKEYWILIKNGNHLPAPWVNIIANPKLGFMISELGTGYTWWKNSRECKLTPWSNDPVLDPPTETAYLRDEASGEVWTAAPTAGFSEAPYKITHGRGYTHFDHERNGITHVMTMYVPLEDPVKIMKLKLKNNSAVPRELSLTYYAEWVLGVQRQSSSPHIVTEWLESASVMIARNTYQETFREANAFLGMYQQQPDSGGPVDANLSWTGDRDEFIGRNGTLGHPAALDHISLSGRTGTFYEPCGAVQMKFTLRPEEERVVYILLGCEASTEAIVSLVEKYKQPQACEAALQEVHDFWTKHLDQIQVATPSPETDILLNGWLLYQSLACRMWARTAFYQAGGAYGFRDQLQDSLVLLHTLPEVTRKQILRHASHQYLEGDVQHWWHEETERGIRTFFSDDLLWLPYTVSRYIEQTGDWLVLDEVEPYIISEPLREDEHERYEPTVVSSEQGTIYDHCLRAIDMALSRIGEHGLPLIGVGDWNDGMNLVGAKGRGESIWLGWFLVDVLQRFSEICSERHEQVKVKQYQNAREDFISALNDHGWDGQWYRRAFTDAGQWLGSIQNEECRIDAIAQSWSIISGGAPKARAVQAMDSFDRELVERDLNVVRLLTPAFDKTEPSPGYIQGYPPGLRENGAQYTHGVIWGIVAWCQLGRGDKAVEMFQMLNPLNHTRTDFEVKRYAAEPYVMAADVYTAAPKEGHAGWTWYTGAASWMYQAGIEWILGIRRRGSKLYIDPCIPNDWPGFTVTYRFGKTPYKIQVASKVKSGNPNSVELDGKNIPLTDDIPAIELIDDNLEHHVYVKI